ncbi:MULTISPECIES: hypothetical protein [unclassified Actinotalea]|uniref:hypothetical protein n=1 Tax=unclassified Actinotalea TaxID=2638618 RepID=UPI0015F611C0|nr:MULTISPECIES: hypothetical protein [unclassified Actinotalea]
MSDQRRRPFGIRFTERFLLPFLGPAEVGDLRRGRPATDADRRRESELRTTLERVVGPDGRSYLVERGDADRAEPGEPPR